MQVGIEAINFYGGRTCLDVRSLFKARSLDLRRFDNLMIHRKSVALPCEDPVSCGVNAAMPLLDQLSEGERNRIELLIAATESGLDFGKSLSTYLHDYLKLSRNCRLFEVKHACYGGTAALQMAVNVVAAGASPGAKALVVATDLAKAAIRGSYVEPSQGIGAVALLVSDRPDILEIDFGANGFYSYEVMDSCRPTPEIETGDSDLSLIAYLDCLENSFRAYAERVEGADFVDSFQYLALHTPFPGMVKGAHRMMMRKLKRADPAQSDVDFNRRVSPSLAYCMEVGNIYSATLYLALCGVIDTAPLESPKRVGLYSYGSGCCAEFFSGIIGPGSKAKLGRLEKRSSVESRYQLSMDEYDRLLDLNLEWRFGLKDKAVDRSPFAAIYDQTMAGRRLLVLQRISNYHREYDWS
ncbi:MAG: hydroxymethylglutaryl-CoA synthase family protein [Verrucomicrobia bacterium]|nr:hydroxymethylglutaryl-CoA synthase family protein [Verrucomicrobiota bacterium]